MENLRKSGKVYKYQVIPLVNSGKSSGAVEELTKIMTNWGAYLDLYAHQANDLFKGGESLFCQGSESMCVASISSAVHREAPFAVSAIELPDPSKDTKSGGTGRVDLWLCTGGHQFYIEGKLRRPSKKLSQLRTTFVGNGKGSASSLISIGFRDYQKSTGTWSQIRRTTSENYNRVMLLMIRFDYENDLENLRGASEKLREIFSSNEKIAIYRNHRTRKDAKPVLDSMNKYDHVALLMAPHGKIALDEEHNRGFIAVASIIQTPRDILDSGRAG